jgi:hypothetical protein
MAQSLHATQKPLIGHSQQVLQAVLQHVTHKCPAQQLDVQHRQTTHPVEREKAVGNQVEAERQKAANQVPLG